MRIVWIWIHQRGGEDVADVGFEFQSPQNPGDTVVNSITVPLAQLLSIDSFRSRLLRERFELTGSERPEDIYICARLDELQRRLQHTHPRMWRAMLRAAKIEGSKSPVRFFAQLDGDGHGDGQGGAA